MGNLFATEQLTGNFDSGGSRVALLELYTSEGCSSCPPADRWFSQTQDDPGVWTEFVPVAFHVDYWDYIGWKDRFAAREYSARQHQYKAEGAVGVVYTPGLFLDGIEWRDWRLGQRPLPDRSRPGVLSFAVEQENFAVHFAPLEDVGALTVNIALLGMGLETDVQAGENRGRHLTHDYVVLGLESLPMELVDGNYRALGSLPTPRVKAPGYAAVAWVSSPNRQAPIQAVGGLLKGTDSR